MGIGTIINATRKVGSKAKGGADNAASRLPFRGGQSTLDDFGGGAAGGLALPAALPVVGGASLTSPVGAGVAIVFLYVVYRVVF